MRVHLCSAVFNEMWIILLMFVLPDPSPSLSLVLLSAGQGRGTSSRLCTNLAVLSSPDISHPGTISPPGDTGMSGDILCSLELRGCCQWHLAGRGPESLLMNVPAPHGSRARAEKLSQGVHLFCLLFVQLADVRRFALSYQMVLNLV